MMEVTISYQTENTYSIDIPHLSQSGHKGVKKCFPIGFVEGIDNTSNWSIYHVSQNPYALYHPKSEF
jgi:hypothetical protein